MDKEPCLKFSKVAFRYKGAPNHQVLVNVSFEVKEGEILGIVGANGTGKTTIMNLISGHVLPCAGEIKRKCCRPVFSVTVPQEYSLLDWKTVSQNIELGLLNHGGSCSQISQIVEDVLDSLGITRYRDAHPPLLSGGTKQRVAIARAIAIDPQLILLDEPFTGLDIETRFRIMGDLRKLINQTHKSAIIVSHHLDEVSTLADRVIVLENGLIREL